MICRKVVLCLILVVCFFGGFAQQEQSSKGIEVKLHYGFLVPHHSYMQIMNERHFPQIQISYVRSGESNNAWNALYGYPQYGLSLLYSSLSSPKYLGNAFGVMSFINFPLIQNKKLGLNFFTGAGVGYLTKKFDFLNNYKNTAIGTHFNALLMGQLEFRYYFSQSSDISCGLALTHFSNGKLGEPNLGINLITFVAGTSYKIPLSSEGKTKIHDDKKEEKQWENNVSLCFAIKKMYILEDRFFTASTLSVNRKYNGNKKIKFGAGIDVFYDTTDKEFFQNKGIQKNSIFYTKTGIYALNDFKIGKLSILFHFGTYLYAYQKNRGMGMIYNRLGVQYYFSHHFSSQIILKTHKAKADFIEYGINYNF